MNRHIKKTSLPVYFIISRRPGNDFWLVTFRAVIPKQQRKHQIKSFINVTLYSILLTFPQNYN